MGMSIAPDIESAVLDAQPTALEARVRELMAKRRVKTMTELAGQCQMRRTHLADILAGRTEPKVSTALKIARGIGTTVEDLFESVA